MQRLPSSIRPQLEAALDRNCEPNEDSNVIDYVCGRKSRGGLVRKRDRLLEKVIELAFEAVEQQEQVDSELEQLRKSKRDTRGELRIAKEKLRVAEEELAHALKRAGASPPQPPKRKLGETPAAYAKRREREEVSFATRPQPGDTPEISEAREQLKQANRKVAQLRAELGAVEAELDEQRSKANYLEGELVPRLMAELLRIEELTRNTALDMQELATE